MGGKYSGPEARAIAAAKYHRYPNDLPAAVNSFNEALPEHGIKDVRKFVQFWGEALVTRFSLDDLPKSGRRGKVPPQRIMECATAFKDGLQDRHGKIRGFVSMAEAVLQCKIIRDTLGEYQVASRTLLDNMVAADPNLVKKSLDVKWEFSDDEKAARVDIARALLLRVAKSPTYLDTTVYVDKCHAWVVPDTTKVWVDRFDYDLLFTSAALKKKAVRLDWFLAVNAMLGLLGVVFSSGTTGKDNEYLVSLNFTSYCTSIITWQTWADNLAKESALNMK